MTKNAKIITLVVVMLVALILSIVMVSVYATTHDDQVSSNGFTIKKTGNTCVITGYSGKDETVIIPHKIAGKKVVGIEPTVFKGKDIKNIEFNGTFENLSLSDYVFAEMNKLEYVKLPEGLKRIPKGAFRNSGALNHITLPNTLEAIDEFAFQGCTQLIYTTNPENDKIDVQDEKKFYLSNNLMRIEKSAFEGCRAITRLVVNDKLEYVGVSAFQNASNLLLVTVSPNSLLSTIDNYAFASTKIKSKNKEGEKLVFPNLKTLGKGAFSGITSYFDYFELNKTLESIGDEVFAGSTSLEYVAYDDDLKPLSYGKGIFKNCTGLTAIKSKTAQVTDVNTLPESMTAVPEFTFSGCYKLLSREDFSIPKTVTEIGNGAFAIYNYTQRSDRQNYTAFKMKVDPENESFKMVKLEDYKVGTTTKPSHYVLTTYDESELIAYFGGYTTYAKDSEGIYDDAYRLTDINGKTIKPANKEKYTYSAFTFLYQNEDLRNNLKKIRSYAFAGIMFDRILIPNAVESIDAFAFTNSSINVVLFDKANCELQKDSFVGMPKDLAICTTIGNDKGNIKTQVLQFKEDGVLLEFMKMNMFA